MKKAIVMAGCGVGLGAGLMYVLDPDRGRRRRALLRDRAAHVVTETAVTLGKSGRDIRHRAGGLVAEVENRFRHEQVSDEVLVERVRSKMGRALSAPGDVEVFANEGNITLRGIVPAKEAEPLLRCVRRVRGVRGVESQLKIKIRHGESPKAGREKGNGNGEHLAGTISPTRRLLATIAGSGLAFYGAKRRGVLGSVVTVVGARMLRRGLDAHAS